MKRKKQTLLFLVAGTLLLGYAVERKIGLPSSADVFESYARGTHMGEVEEILWEEPFGEEGTFISLGRCERGLLSVVTMEAKPFGWKFSFEGGLPRTAISHDGIAVIFLDEKKILCGYTEREDIAEVTCWGGYNEKYAYRFSKKIGEENYFEMTLDMAEKFSLKPIWDSGWGSEDMQIYAVEGRNADGEVVYWYSDYGIGQEEFSQKNLAKLVWRWKEENR